MRASALLTLKRSKRALVDPIRLFCTDYGSLFSAKATASVVYPSVAYPSVAPVSRRASGGGVLRPVSPDEKPAPGLSAIGRRHFSSSSSRLNSTSKRTSSNAVAWDKQDHSGDGDDDGTFRLLPVIPYSQTPRREVPHGIPRPPYARTGAIPYFPESIMLHDEPSIERMRIAARLARRILDLACDLAKPGVTTDEIDAAVHEAILEHGAYPSPLNYAGFPKSLCSSVNEVICHGIPDKRPLQIGDVVSFDVSNFIGGVHGDNCATVIVGDESDDKSIVATADNSDWRGVPYRTQFDNAAQERHFRSARRLVSATRESLYAAIDECRPGGCLSDIGAAVQDVCDSYGYSTVRKYRGHGIHSVFHCAPYVKHYRNSDKLELRPGMIFTIEPMLTEKSSECFEWDDDWTVATVDGSLAAQFEHTILITEEGNEILTIPPSEYE